MMRKIIIPLALVAICTPALAADRDRSDQRDAATDYAERENCVLPQVIAPSFNNNAASIEQMRIAAVTVRKAGRRQGLGSAPICGSQHDPRALDGEMTMGAPEPVAQDEESSVGDERGVVYERDAAPSRD